MSPLAPPDHKELPPIHICEGDDVEYQMVGDYHKFIDDENAAHDLISAVPVCIRIRAPSFAVHKDHIVFDEDSIRHIEVIQESANQTEVISPREGGRKLRAPKPEGTYKMLVLRVESRYEALAKITKSEDLLYRKIFNDSNNLVSYILSASHPRFSYLCTFVCTSFGIVLIFITFSSSPL